MERAALDSLSAPGLVLADLRWLALGDLGSVPLCGDGDLVAAVVSRFRGRSDGTAIVALDPEDALEFVRGLAPMSEPLDAFVSLGSSLARGLADGLYEGGDEDLAMGEGALDERPLATIVLSTHAPSDTAVLAAHFSVAVSEEAAVSVFAYLLVDAKLDAVSASTR